MKPVLTRSLTRLANAKLEMVFVLIAALAISLTAWLPTRYDPYHWDSAGFVVNAALDLKNAYFYPFIASHSDFAHPPLFIAFLAAVWTVFSQTPLISHLVNLPLLPVLILSTYLLGKKFGPSSVALTAAFFTGLTPVILAEYSTIYLDLPAAVFGISALTAWYYRKDTLAVTLLTLAVLIKLTPLVLLPMFLLRDGKKSTAKPANRFLLCIPLLSLIVWFAYHYLETGWIFTRPGRAIRSFSNPQDLINGFWFTTRSLFLYQARWIPTIVALISAVYVWYKQRDVPIHALSSLITLGLTIALFTLTGEFAQRYAIVVIPVFYVSIFSILYDSLVRLYPKIAPSLFLIIATVGLVGLAFAWHPRIPTTDAYDFRPPSDLTYRDLMMIHRQAAAYLEYTFPEAQIFGSFPENLYLTQTYQGYVTHALEFDLCRNYQHNPDVTQIIYVHAYSPEQKYCRVLLDALTAEPVNHFFSAGKWLELYQVTATGSSRLETLR